jgi:hypothetical protein
VYAIAQTLELARRSRGALRAGRWAFCRAHGQPSRPYRDADGDQSVPYVLLQDMIKRDARMYPRSARF